MTSIRNWMKKWSADYFNNCAPMVIASDTANVYIMGWACGLRITVASSKIPTLEEWKKMHTINHA